MSVKLMSLVYEAHFHDITFTRKAKKKTGEEHQKTVTVLAPNLKSVCLALADHANDEGEGSYPSVETLSSKTELSEVTVISCLKAMKQEQIIFYAGRSKWSTCNYTVKKDKLNEMTGWERQKRLSPKSKAASTSEVKPLQLKGEAALPKPSIHPKPSVGATAPKSRINPNTGNRTDAVVRGDPMDGMLAAAADAQAREQEVRLANAVNLFSPAYQDLARAFILATGIFPLERQVSGWCQAFKDQQVSTGLTPDDLTEACKQMFADKLTIKDPFSVMNKVPSIRMKRRKDEENKPVERPKSMFEEMTDLMDSPDFDRAAYMRRREEARKRYFPAGANSSSGAKSAAKN